MADNCSNCCGNTIKLELQFGNLQQEKRNKKAAKSGQNHLLLAPENIIKFHLSQVKFANKEGKAALRSFWLESAKEKQHTYTHTHRETVNLG